MVLHVSFFVIAHEKVQIDRNKQKTYNHCDKFDVAGHHNTIFIRKIHMNSSSIKKKKSNCAYCI